MRENVIGNKYRNLLVIADAPDYVGKSGVRQRRVLCLCDCGNTKDIMLQSLKQGKTVSCGCVKDAKTKHRMSDTKEFAVWIGIKYRCNNPSSPDYPKYGGRGIAVCDRWLDTVTGFTNFIEDMGMRPADGGDWTIERLDVNKGYSPDNCIWMLRKDQLNNRRNVYKWLIDGEEMTIKCIQSRWKELSKIKSLFYGRMASTGMDRNKSAEILQGIFSEKGIEYKEISFVQ